MTRMLRQGTSGADVRALQDVLNYHVRRLQPLVVDGIFGPKTDARVREFQRANRLAPDGIVGPLTEAELYEVTVVTVPLVFTPNERRRRRASFGAPTAGGIVPPQLVPPFHWAGPPAAPPAPFVPGGSFHLAQSTRAPLPAFNPTSNALGLQITVPTRKDPVDPTVASHQMIVQLIDELPFDARFKVFLASLVPTPITMVRPPSAGFTWGAQPLFDPFDPKGLGVKGKAAFSVRVRDGLDGMPSLMFSAWGDGKLFLDFAGAQGEARPRAQGSGQLFVGVRGSF